MAMLWRQVLVQTTGCCSFAPGTAFSAKLFLLCGIWKLISAVTGEGKRWTVRLVSMGSMRLRCDIRAVPKMSPGTYSQLHSGLVDANCLRLGEEILLYSAVYVTLIKPLQLFKGKLSGVSRLKGERLLTHDVCLRRAPCLDQPSANATMSLNWSISRFFILHSRACWRLSHSFPRSLQYWHKYFIMTNVCLFPVLSLLLKVGPTN